MLVQRANKPINALGFRQQRIVKKMRIQHVTRKWFWCFLSNFYKCLPSSGIYSVVIGFNQLILVNQRLLHPVGPLPAQQSLRSSNPDRIDPQRTASRFPEDPGQHLQFHGPRYKGEACLLYLTFVDKGDGTFQFLAIYRNLVGTFLAITTWTKGASSFEVNTLVRLGNGDGAKYGADYQPVAVSPLKLRYSLGLNEIIIEVSDSGHITINGSSLAEGISKTFKPDELLVAKCKEFSAYSKEKLWSYTPLWARLASRTTACLVTYLNIVGTFFVIGSRDATTNANVVNNFARLGNGYEQSSGGNYKPVNFNKVHLRLTNFVEIA